MTSPGAQTPGPETDPVCLVWVTAPDAEQAAELARALVGERLVACVNVVPGIRSIYRWEGSVQEDSEVMLLMKTSAARVAALTARVEALHPYDVPAVLAVPFATGSARYLDWVRAETSPGGAAS